MWNFGCIDLKLQDKIHKGNDMDNLVITWHLLDAKEMIDDVVVG